MEQHVKPRRMDCTLTFSGLVPVQRELSLGQRSGFVCSCSKLLRAGYCFSLSYHGLLHSCDDYFTLAV